MNEVEKVIGEMKRCGTGDPGSILRIYAWADRLEAALQRQPAIARTGDYGNPVASAVGALRRRTSSTEQAMKNPAGGQEAEVPLLTAEMADEWLRITPGSHQDEPGFYPKFRNAVRMVANSRALVVPAGGIAEADAERHQGPNPRQAAEAPSGAGQPVAWMYSSTNVDGSPITRFAAVRWTAGNHDWQETPLYALPEARHPQQQAAWRDAGSLAFSFHESYERLAPVFGYETRTETRCFDPTTPNGRLMIAVCGELLNELRNAGTSAAAPESVAPVEPPHIWGTAYDYAMSQVRELNREADAVQRSANGMRTTYADSLRDEAKIWDRVSRRIKDACPKAVEPDGEAVRERIQAYADSYKGMATIGDGREPTRERP
jgi:hypothetical protein